MHLNRINVLLFGRIAICVMIEGSSLNNRWGDNYRRYFELARMMYMEETNAVPQETKTKTEATVSERTLLLTRFIEEHAAALMITLRGYVRRAHLVPDIEEPVQEAALELLDEVYLEAIQTGSHFDPS